MSEGDILFDRMPDYSGDKKSAPTARIDHARVTPEEQKAKDVDQVAILENELAKKIKWLEENNRKPTPDNQKEAEVFKDQLARTESDISALKRELSRKGVSTPNDAASATEGSAPSSLGEGDINFNELPDYKDDGKTADSNGMMGITPAQTALGAGAAGALYGAAKTPTYNQTFADLARDVYGVPSEAVEAYLMKKYRQPPTSAQVARQTAQELSEQAAARAASTQAAAAKMGDVPLDESGVRRWALSRVAPTYAPPHSLTDKIITLTGSAGAPGSAENIVAENAERVRKLQAMGHDVANMPKSGDLLLAENYRTRGSPLRPPTPSSPLPTTAPAVTTSAVPASETSYIDDLAARIQKAGGLASVLSRAAKAGLYGGATAMSGLDLWHAINSMNQEGVTPENAALGAQGAGFLGALKYPRIGLGTAGAAKVYEARKNIQDTGITPQNAAQALSGAGIAAMPYGRFGAIAGGLAQIPELGLAAKQWLLEHPEFGPSLQKGYQTYGQSRFGLD